MRDLDNREARNILKIKMDEIVNDLLEVLRGKVILLRALNFLSPRFISFIAPVKGKGSINPFFKLLDSPGKSVKML
jgi:hypothetical protein